MEKAPHTRAITLRGCETDPLKYKYSRRNDINILTFGEGWRDDNGECDEMPKLMGELITVAKKRDLDVKLTERDMNTER